MGFRGRRGGVPFARDEFTLAAAGAQTLSLTYPPDVDSLHVYCNGLEQRHGEAWSVNGTALTLSGQPYPAPVGAVVEALYAYASGAAATPPAAVDQVVVDWQSNGWRYLQVADTDTVDRSAPGFDDSTWVTAPAAFANDTTNLHPWGFPKASSVWQIGTKLWLRRRLSIPVGATRLRLTVRVDNWIDAYLDGSLIASDHSGGGTLGPYEVAVGAGSSPVLALLYDDPASSAISGDWSYADAHVEVLS